MDDGRPIDQFFEILRSETSEYVDNFDIISGDYNKGHWQSNAQEIVEPAFDWNGAIVDGIPCLFRQFDDPSDTDLLRKTNKQAHIARSYLRQHQVVDLHVFIFLTGGQADIQELLSRKNELEEDGKIARKCADIFIEGEDIATKCHNLLARSPFSPIFRRPLSNEDSSGELNFLDWEGRLRTFIGNETSLSLREETVLQAIVEEIRNVREPSNEGADTWPQRMVEIIYGPDK